MRRRDVLLAAALPALAALARSARAALPDAVDTRDDAVARWLSGTAPLPDAPTLDWLGYASTEDARWARAAPRIRAMREWSRRELASLVPGDRPVVYPFGGPDALHALALFEAAPRLLLIGLEPAVGVPAGARDERPGYFSELGDAMADLHRLTFFRTRDLASQMNDVGVLPVLVATLVRMGGRVTRIAQPASGRASVDWLSSDDHPHRLEYAQADLSNAALARRPDFVATLAGLAPHVTFVKAASYLLGEPRFSHVRRLILDGSELLVQDDTGVPFSDLDAGWGTRLFGRYVAPASPFEDRAQPDLASAYARQAPASLPFGIGYHVSARSSNLLAGVRVRTRARAEARR